MFSAIFTEKKFAIFTAVQIQYKLGNVVLSVTTLVVISEIIPWHLYLLMFKEKLQCPFFCQSTLMGGRWISLVAALLRCRSLVPNSWETFSAIFTLRNSLRYLRYLIIRSDVHFLLECNFSSSWLP